MSRWHQASTYGAKLGDGTMQMWLRRDNVQKTSSEYAGCKIRRWYNADVIEQRPCPEDTKRVRRAQISEMVQCRHDREETMSRKENTKRVRGARNSEMVKCRCEQTETMFRRHQASTQGAKLGDGTVRTWAKNSKNKQSQCPEDTKRVRGARNSLIVQCGRDSAVGVERRREQWVAISRSYQASTRGAKLVDSRLRVQRRGIGWAGWRGGK